ncbi:MAG: pentapeptide repeat-containing protein [Bacteroidota bacterium]
MENITIGRKISEARKRMKLSQSQLAAQLFISPQAVGKWERGESLPDLIMLNRLAQILGVDLNYFSTNADTRLPEKAPEDEKNARAESKPEWDMSFGNWEDADFSGLKNLHERFAASNMRRCRFNGSDLSGLHLKANHVADCDFSSSRLENSHIQNSQLSGNRFTNSSLKETMITGSHIEGCDFTAADLSGLTMKSCDFGKNTLENAVWKRTSFHGTQLNDIVFEGSIEDCSFENCAFSGVTFRNARFINTFFKNKSLKRIRLIDCEADRLSYAFLKNGKADMSGVKLLEAENG